MGINLNYNPAYKQTGFGKKKQSDVNFERKILFKKNTMPNQKSYVPTVSSLLVPGSGQLMNGQHRKGGIAFILGLPMAIVAGVSHFATRNSANKNIQKIGTAVAGLAGFTYLADLVVATIDARRNTECINKKDK